MGEFKCHIAHFLPRRLCIFTDQHLCEVNAEELGHPEKEELTFGFIKLTDMAPIAIAYEKGYFEDEGLYVKIEAQANWKVLLDGVVDGRLDGHTCCWPTHRCNHRLWYKSEHYYAFLNGPKRQRHYGVEQNLGPNEENIPKRADGKPAIRSKRRIKASCRCHRAAGKPFNMGMIPSFHNYGAPLASSRRYPPWYYAPHKGDTPGQLDADVLPVTPPPQMPATLEAGTIEGYCGRTWNQQAVFKVLVCQW